MKKTVTLLLVFFTALTGYSQKTTQEIEDLMKNYHEHNNFIGTVVVAKEGEILYSNGFGYANIAHEVENTPKTKVRLASVTKQFTSMLVMQKVAEGKMDLEATINEYIPEYPEPQGSKVTIHHLLSHTSGFPHYAGIPNFTPDYSRLPWEHRDFVELFWDLDLIFEPGEEYSYSSFGYYLLGYILEEVSGKDFDKLLEEQILDPVGMHNTGIIDHKTILKNEAEGYNHSLDGFVKANFRDLSTALATGDMYTTVKDMVLWERAIAKNKLLDEELQSKIFTPNIDGYGYGWRIQKVGLNEEDSVQVNGHGGSTNGFQCLARRIPADDYYVGVFANVRPIARSEMVNNIIRVLYDQPVDFIRSGRVATARVLEKEGVEEAVEHF
ncbi:MAG: serine hydrolase domain-containing protein [Bacteroidales bacterium]